MKFLTVRDLRGKSSEVWRELPDEKEMIVTHNGRPIAMLTPVTDVTLEDSIAAWRRVRAQQALERIQRKSVERGTDRLSMKEIDTEIRKTRKSRKVRTA